MKHPFVGLLTAVKNTAIAMTVSDAFETEVPEGSGEESVTVVTAFYFANGVMQTLQLDEEHFIGFGDYLIYEDGAFTEVGFHEEEEDGDDEEEEEEEESDAAPTV